MLLAACVGEGGREGGRERGREGGREGGREEGREGERKGGRERGREAGKQGTESEGGKESMCVCEGGKESCVREGECVCVREGEWGKIVQGDNKPHHSLTQPSSPSSLKHSLSPTHDQYIQLFKECECKRRNLSNSYLQKPGTSMSCCDANNWFPTHRLIVVTLRATQHCVVLDFSI